ncbi:MAG: PKD domain-containing protein [Candidatus Thorarchaeota archaeon]|jgi:PKD repeat protein
MGRRILVSSAIIAMLVMGMPLTFAQAWSGSVSLSPYNAYQGETTQFTLTFEEERGDSTDIEWIFAHFCWQSGSYGYYFKEDDGSKVSVSAYGSRSFSRYVSVSESTLGSCLVEIEVRAKAVGDWWTEEKDFTDLINIKSIPPLQISASGNPNSGDSPLTVSFSTSVSGGLSPHSYSWSFGDGGSSSQKNPSHTYDSPGTYTAKVTVRDGASNQQTKSDTITIHVSEPPSGGGGGGGGGGSGGGGTGEGGYTAAVGSEFLILVVVLIIVGIIIAVALKGRKKSPTVYQAPKPQETYTQQQPYPAEQSQQPGELPPDS